MKKKLLSLLLFPFKVFAATVAIDVGHAITSPGATSAYGDSEFYYNQKMALDVAKKVKSQGHIVNLIGYNGDIAKIEHRPQLAKEAKSNLFVSIHHDSVAAEDLTPWEYNGQALRYNDKVSGFSIFISEKNPYIDKSLTCAVKVSDALIESGFKPNYYHATTIKGKRRDLFFKDRPVYRYDDLIVLKKSEMPALLIEAGVIINRNEAIWITKEEVRDAFSNSVAIGLQNCLEKKFN